MSLPPWSFILVGLLVTIMSYRIGEKMQFFFYVGLLLLMWGTFRQVWTYVIKGPTKREEMVMESKATGAQIYSCPYCAVSVYSTAKFCHECGGRLR